VNGNRLADILKIMLELPVDELPQLIGELEEAKAWAWQRLTTPSNGTQEHDELLDVATAAKRLGLSKDYLYRHHKDYAFARKEGGRLLFSALGIDRHIRQK